MPITHLTRIGPEEGGNFEHEWTGPFVTAHLLSNVGKKRQHNEDSCMLCVPKYEGASLSVGMLFAVADGMGGASAGEHASRITLETLADTLSCEAKENIPPRLCEAVEAANSRVYGEASSNPELQGMGTTLSAVLLHGNRAYLAQVGDSRTYLARRGAGLHQITNDHSVVAEQVRKGLLTEEEARTHSLKNLITRAVGIKDTIKVDLFSIRLVRGDTLLLCSDGLCNMVGDAEIENLLKHSNPQGAARQLVGRAIEEGGTDNITCVLVRITARPPKIPLVEGAEVITLPRGGLLGRIIRPFTQLMTSD